MPFADVEIEGIMEFSGESKFEFCLDENQKVSLSIKPLDQFLTKIYLTLRVQTIQQTSAKTPQQSNQGPQSTKQGLGIQQGKQGPDILQSKQGGINEVALVQYGQVFEIWDFVSFRKFYKRNAQNRTEEKLHNKNSKYWNDESTDKSLLWAKLYLHEYFHMISVKHQKQEIINQMGLTSQAPPPIKSPLVNSTFLSTNKPLLRKVYKNKSSLQQILQSSTQQQPTNTLSPPNQLIPSPKNFFLLKIDPTLLPIKNHFFQSHLLLVLPRKTIPSQKILSQLQIQKEKQLHQNQLIQNLFFDHKTFH